MLILAIPFVLGLSSCGSGRSGPPDIVLIVIDTLRADHLPFYGYKKNTAPFLYDLAGKGSVFERVHSTSSWTAPATASLLTSLQPAQHGVLSGFLAAGERNKAKSRITLDRIPEEVETIAEVLNTGEDACFLTLGDTLLYSTYICRR